MDALRQLSIVALALVLATVSTPDRFHWAAVIVLGVLISALWRYLGRLAASGQVLPRMTAWMVAFAMGASLDAALAPPQWWASAAIIAIPLALIWVMLGGRSAS